MSKQERGQRERAKPAAVRNTHKHMAWQQIRAETLRQKRRKEPESEEAVASRDWRRQWGVRRVDRTNPTCHVVTINVGPRGLQVCVENLPWVVHQHQTPPMVIHLQDIRITRRLFKTIQDLLRKLMPDYTAYANIKTCKKSRRCQMGVMTLLRNDVAHTAEQVHLDTFDREHSGERQSAEMRATACAGRVLVLKTAPPGAPGPVWHVNAYQHTSSAKASLRKALWQVCGDVVDDAKAQGEAISTPPLTKVSGGQETRLWIARAERGSVPTEAVQQSVHTTTTSGGDGRGRIQGGDTVRT